MNITIIAGARPNFMKIAPIIKEITKQQKQGKNIHFRLVHTGQHYDKNLSDTFFEDLKIPLPDVNLNVKSGSQAVQTAAIMVAFEKELLENPTDIVLVVGDVNSTLACAIVAKKLLVKVAHVEGGIRSFDLTMPEEINRMVTDAITDYFYVTSRIAIHNLKQAGIKEHQIHLVGNTMIDTLIVNLDNLKQPKIWNEQSLSKSNYIVLTLHRPSNVDQEELLKEFITEIVLSSKGMPIIFPVHPRTKLMLAKLDLNFKNLFFVDPLGYLEFNYLVKNSLCVITDSGGITEETTFLKIPCLTLRTTTERPETITIGTNMLIGTNAKALREPMEMILNNTWKSGGIPEFWDGKAAERIVNHLVSL